MNTQNLFVGFSTDEIKNTQPKKLAQQYLNDWDMGIPVKSVSMGGKDLGVGYELAIQLIAVIFLKNMISSNFNILDQDSEKLKQSWADLEAAVIKDPEFDAGVTGAMLSGAKNLAAVFYRRGPSESMKDEIVKDRQILVSKDKGVYWYN